MKKLIVICLLLIGCVGNNLTVSQPTGPNGARPDFDGTWISETGAGLYKETIVINIKRGKISGYWTAARWDDVQLDITGRIEGDKVIMNHTSSAGQLYPEMIFKWYVVSVDNDTIRGYCEFRSQKYYYNFMRD